MERCDVLPKPGLFVHRVEAIREIEAPASVVFGVITAPDAWPRWSTMLTTKHRGTFALGERIELGLRTPQANYDFTALVSALEKDRVFEWVAKTGFTGIMDGRHRFELEAVAAHRSRLRNVESYSGLIVPVLRRTAMMKAAPDGFRRMNDEIAMRAEQLARAGGTVS